MRQAVVCPDLMQYQQLAADQLADADEEAMLEHLERCDACARKVSTLVERDRLVEFIRRYQARGDGPADEGIGRLVERMSKLRPGATPAPAVQTTPPAHNTAPIAALIFACSACGKALKVKGELAGKMVKCPHCQQAVCAAAKSAGALVSGVSAAALSVLPRPGTVAGAGFRTGANVAGKLDSTVDHQPASGQDKALYDFLAPPQAPDELGRLGPYRVLQVLGAGGMGVVFRAEDPQLMRLVALKAMLPALAASASARQRFLREARAAAAIKHDHIVTIYQVGEDRGVPFLAMDFLEGEPLDARLQRAGKLPVAEVLRIGREIALGLAAANQRGLIHRDIKPANIWLETHGEPGTSAIGGRVKILDFGLARAVGAEAQLTQMGAIVGTPAYMAPEQAQGKSVDHRCDLFSLGCVLYRMATGEPAFRGTDVISTLMAIATEHPRPPHELEATLPPALSELIMGLLAKEPGGRPPSAQAVAATLERIAAVGAASRAAPTLSEVRLGSPDLLAALRPRKKWPLMAGLAACLLLGLAGLWAAGVFKLKTKDGTIVLANLPADAEVFVDGEKVALKLPGDGKLIEIQVAPGQRKLEIKTAGFKMITRDVTLASGERNPPIDIRLEPLAAPSEKPVPPTLPKKETPDLDPDRRAAEYVLSIGGVVRVNDEVDDIKAATDLPQAPFRLTYVDLNGNPKVRNAGLAAFKGCKHLTFLQMNRTQVKDQGLAYFKDCKNLESLYLWCAPISEAGLANFKDCKNLRTLNCQGTLVSDLSPLKDLKLTFLDCKGTPVKDLSPLKAMNLAHLDCTNTQVSDLSPLKNMNLTFLSCANTPVSDLTSLKDMKLTTLICNDMRVSDLSPLKNMKLTTVICFHTQISDLTPLKGMPLQEIKCDFQHDRDAEILRSLKTLERINDKPAVEFWKAVEANKAQVVSPAAPSKALEALRRDNIPPKALALAGDGDANKAPASLVSVLGEAQPIHSQAVMGLAYSPDGRWLASGSADKTIMLRDTATGNVKRILLGHTEAVSAVAFSRDSRTLLSASYDGSLRLWSVDKDEKPIVLDTKLGSKVVLRMAVSSDGRFVAAGGESGLVKLWKWGAWEKPTEFPALTGKVKIRALALSADGELLACGGEREANEKENIARVRIYATVDGSLKRTMTHPIGVVLALSFSHDGKHLASVGGNGNGRVWEATSGKQIAELSRHYLNGEWPNSFSVAWSPDDKMVAVSGHSVVVVHDPLTGTRQTIRWDFAGRLYNQVPVGAVTFNPRGKMLAAGGHYGDVPVWDTTTWQRKYLERGHRHFVRSVAFNAEASELLSLGDESALLRWQLIQLRKPLVQHLDFDKGTPLGSAGSTVFCSRDGKTIVISWHAGIVVWNTVTKKETVSTTGSGPLGYPHIGYQAVSPDCRTLAAARDGRLLLWDLPGGREVHRFPTEGGRWAGLAFSHDGGFLAAYNDRTKRLMIWNVATGAEGCSWEVKSLAWVSAFHPHGKTLATGHEDGSIQLWDTATGQKLRTLAGHSARIRSLKFTPDGKTLASSGDDGIIRLWNPEQSRAREIIPLGPANRPLTFDLDSSGKYLFAAGHCPVIFVLRLPQESK